MKKSNEVQKGNVHSKISQNEFSRCDGWFSNHQIVQKNANLAKIPRRCEAFSFELPKIIEQYGYKELETIRTTLKITKKNPAAQN